MKKTIVGMLMAVFCASLLAQDLPMLRSKDALRTHALEETAMVSASIGATLPVGDNAFDHVPVESSTAEGIMNTIRNMKLSVDVVNPLDYLYTGAGAYNSDGDQLFYGHHRFKLVNGEAGYVMPPDYGVVTMELNDRIPIRIAGATSSIITILNAQGEAQSSSSLRVYNGKVFFPEPLAGTNAILSVFVTGGKAESSGWRYWNVATGKSIIQKRFSMTFRPTIEGVLSFKDSHVMVQVPTTNSIGQNMTAEFMSSGTGSIIVSFWTTEDKWFNGAWVRKAGTDQWQYYSTTVFESVGLMGFLLDVHMGIYYIVPSWDDGDLIELGNPWEPTFEGGKG